jgi:hypothetical protein
MDRRVRAFERLAAALKADPECRRLVRNWYVPGDVGWEKELPANVASVRLTPQMAAPTPAHSNGTRVVYRSETRVFLDVRAASGRWEDSARLTLTVQDAILATYQGNYAALATAGVEEVLPGVPAATPQDQAAGRGDFVFVTHHQ